ncbi:MAG: hypothetical protein V7K89_18290 [Nostoc sp.]|uniref:hypothetical protein n=1 Tax=Nostoc sp. TaxID=1180 RepID=UPI002FF4E791
MAGSEGGRSEEAESGEAEPGVDSGEWKQKVELAQEKAKQSQTKLDQALVNYEDKKAQAKLWQAKQSQVQAQLWQAKQSQTQLQQEFVPLISAVLMFILMLVLLLRQGNKISLPLTGQLIIVLPEECIAELEALHQQMKSDQRSIWFIRRIMLRSILESLWAFFILINFENLWLPRNKGRTK